jgi:hypothetical protein
MVSIVLTKKNLLIFNSTMLNIIFIKIRHILWYLFQPKYYQHFFYLIKRKFLFNHDTIENRQKAYKWAKENAVSHIKALKIIGLEGSKVGLDNETIVEGKKTCSKIISKNVWTCSYSFNL